MSETPQIQAEQLVEVPASPSEEYLSEEPDSPDDGSSEETTTTQVSAEATPDTPPPATTQQPPEVDIDQAVARINELAIGTLYQGSAQIGEYVLQTFFNNDPELAQSKHPFKNASYRTLCGREDLLVSPANLNRMVRVAIQERFFRAEGLDVQTLSFSHKAALVRIPNIPAKIEFVRNLIAGPVSTRQLSDRVKELLLSLPSNGHPDGSRKIIFQLASLEKWVSKNNFNDIDIDTEVLQRMKQKGKIALLERTQTVETQLVAINRVLSQIKEALNSSQGAGGQTP